MSNRPRFYATLLEDHFRRNRQMALVSGPRQVGKTTACRTVGSVYLNWDNQDDRRILLKDGQNSQVQLIKRMHIS